MKPCDDSPDRNDSAAAFVVRNERYSESFSRNPSGARSARTFVCQSLSRRGATDSLIRDFELVVGELASNAVEHGVSDNISVTMDFTDSRWWVVEVAAPSDDLYGHILDPNRWSIAGPDAESGRGLGITRTLMDDISSTFESNCLTIRCRRRASATAQA
jgi:anti-sigma regulatory factor (Ser/Thr protein kinase)